MHDMLDPQDRDAGLADIADGGDELEALALRQAAGDLVEQQKPRRRRERARHLQPLAFEQRQRARERVGALDEAEPFENLAAGLRRLALRFGGGHRPRRPAGSRTR